MHLYFNGSFFFFFFFFLFCSVLASGTSHVYSYFFRKWFVSFPAYQIIWLLYQQKRNVIRSLLIVSNFDWKYLINWSVGPTCLYHWIFAFSVIQDSQARVALFEEKHVMFRIQLLLSILHVALLVRMKLHNTCSEKNWWSRYSKVALFGTTYLLCQRNSWDKTSICVNISSPLT